MIDWQELTKMTDGGKLVIEKVRLINKDVSLEGNFELPPLANLTSDDQIFVAAFIRCHGSIKQMEKYFGVSYPTIKNRLNQIGKQLDFVEIDIESEDESVLDRLEKGEISAKEAAEELRKKSD